MNTVNDLKTGDILTNVNHGFDIKIVAIGKKNTRYINLETGEKIKSFTSKFNWMLRNGIFTKFKTFSGKFKYENRKEYLKSLFSLATNGHPLTY